MKSASTLSPTPPSTSTPSTCSTRCTSPTWASPRTSPPPSSKRYDFWNSINPVQIALPGPDPAHVLPQSQGVQAHQRGAGSPAVLHRGALQGDDDLRQGIGELLPLGTGQALRAAELPGVDRGAALRGTGVGGERRIERWNPVPLRRHSGERDEGDAVADELVPARRERSRERGGDAGGRQGGRAAVL